MSLDEIIELAGKIFLIPNYYDTFERNFSLAATVFSPIVGVVLSKEFEHKGLALTAVLSA